MKKLISSFMVAGLVVGLMAPLSAATTAKEKSKSMSCCPKMSSKCGAKAANCKACKQVTCTNKTKCMKMGKGLNTGMKGMHMKPGMMGMKMCPGMKSGMTGKRMNPNMKKVPGKAAPVKK